MPYTIDVILIRILLVCEVLHIDPAFLLCAKIALRGQQLMSDILLMQLYRFLIRISSKGKKSHTQECLCKTI